MYDSLYLYTKILFTAMYNWSVDENLFQKENPEAYKVWKIEQMINYGLGDEKLDRDMLKKYWDKLRIDPITYQYLKFILWPE